MAKNIINLTPEAERTLAEVRYLQTINGLEPIKNNEHGVNRALELLQTFLEEVSDDSKKDILNLKMRANQ